MPPVSPRLAHTTFDTSPTLPAEKPLVSTGKARRHSKSRATSRMGPPLPIDASTASSTTHGVRTAATAMATSGSSGGRLETDNKRRRNASHRASMRAANTLLTTTLFYTPVSPRLSALDSPAGPCTPLLLEESDGMQGQANNYWQCGASASSSTPHVPFQAHALSEAIGRRLAGRETTETTVLHGEQHGGQHGSEKQGNTIDRSHSPSHIPRWPA